MQSHTDNLAIKEAHQDAVYQKAQELLRDRNIIAQALSAEGMTYLNHSGTDRYLDNLADLVIADDADAFGRQLLDQVIHYVWAVAEQEVRKDFSTRTH